MLFAGKTVCGNIARGILLANRPMGNDELNSGGGGVMFMKLPAAADSSSDIGGAHVIQLSHYSGTCPKGWCMSYSQNIRILNCFFFTFNTFFFIDLIHITSRASSSSSNAEQDLTPYVQRLLPFFGDTSVLPIVWSMYFNIPSCGKCSAADENHFERIHIACGPSFELDYDSSINNVNHFRPKYKRIMVQTKNSLHYRLKTYLRNCIQAKSSCRVLRIQRKSFSVTMSKPPRVTLRWAMLNQSKCWPE